MQTRPISRSPTAPNRTGPAGAATPPPAVPQPGSARWQACAEVGRWRCVRAAPARAARARRPEHQLRREQHQRQAEDRRARPAAAADAGQAEHERAAPASARPPNSVHQLADRNASARVRRRRRAGRRRAGAWFGRDHLARSVRRSMLSGSVLEAGHAAAQGNAGQPARTPPPHPGGPASRPVP